MIVYLAATHKYGGTPDDSRSGERFGCSIPLGYEAAALVGRNVRIHDGHDRSPGVGHMGRQQAAGVSILSWSAYLASALLWLWFGIRQQDRNIYLPCLGWIALDGAVIAGAVVYG